MRRSSHYYTREERKTMIVTAFAVKFQAHGRVWMTMGEIAQQLDMAISSHLKGIVHELESEGRLERRVGHRPGWPELAEYSLAEGTYALPKPRLIPVKSKGVLEGQLSLW